MDVHDVVVLNDVFSSVKMKTFYFFLGTFYRSGNDSVFYGFLFWKAKAFHEGGHFVASKSSHEVVLHGDVELTEAWIALSAGSSSELVVDSSGFVSFCSEYGKASKFFYACAEFDVGSSSGHVGCDGDGA